MTCLIKIPQTRFAFERFIIEKVQERIGKRPVCLDCVGDFFPPKNLEHLYEAVQQAVYDILFYEQ